MCISHSCHYVEYAKNSIVLCVYIRIQKNFSFSGWVAAEGTIYMCVCVREYLGSDFVYAKIDINYVVCELTSSG